MGTGNPMNLRGAAQSVYDYKQAPAAGSFSQSWDGQDGGSMCKKGESKEQSIKNVEDPDVIIKEEFYCEEGKFESMRIFNLFNVLMMIHYE